MLLLIEITCIWICIWTELWSSVIATGWHTKPGGWRLGELMSWLFLASNEVKFPSGSWLTFFRFETDLQLLVRYVGRPRLKLRHIVRISVYFDCLLSHFLRCVSSFLPVCLSWQMLFSLSLVCDSIDLVQWLSIVVGSKVSVFLRLQQSKTHGWLSAGNDKGKYTALQILTVKLTFGALAVYSSKQRGRLWVVC